MSVERSARKREACVDIGVHEQTRLNVNLLPALLNESHEVCFGKRHEGRTSVNCESAMQKQTKAAHIALSLCVLSLPRSALSMCLCFQFQCMTSLSIVFVFCLPFFFCSQRALRMLLASLSYCCLRSLHCALLS